MAITIDIPNLNTNNYSNYTVSNLPLLSYDHVDLTDPISSRGCQAHIANKTCKYLFIHIDSYEIKSVLDITNRYSKKKYTLDDVLDIFNDMGFKITYVIVDKTHIFELPYGDNPKARYYAYTMLRHFYYYQNVLIRYLILYPDLKSDYEKIIALKILSLGVSNVFIATIINDPNVTFNDIFRMYLNRGHNYNSSTGNNNIVNIGYVDLTSSFLNCGLIENVRDIIDWLRNIHEEQKNTICAIKDNTIDTIKNIKNHIDLYENTGNYRVDFENRKLFINQNHPFSNHFKIGTGSIICYTNIKSLNIFKIHKVHVFKNKINVNIANMSSTYKFETLVFKNPKVIANFNSRRKGNCNVVINNIEDIKNISTRKKVYSLCNMTPLKYPIVLQKNNKRLTESSVIVTSDRKMKQFIKNNNLNLYASRNYIKPNEKHYIHFSTKINSSIDPKIYLYQIENVVTKVNKEINLDSIHSNNVLKNVIAEATKCFLRSKLHVGVIEIEVNSRTKIFQVSDINTYRKNKIYSTIITIKELDKLI